MAFESTFAVHHIDLVSSAPSPEGHVYASVARAPLGPSALGDSAPGDSGREGGALSPSFR